MTEFLWPKHDVRLFEPGRPGDPWAWGFTAAELDEDGTPTGQFAQPDLNQFASLFAESSRSLIEKARSTGGLVSPFVIPGFFMFRHFVELTLKALTLQARQLNGSSSADFDDGHDLVELWRKLRPLLESIDFAASDNSKDYAAVDAQLRQLNDVDAGSDAFRYPVSSKKGARSRLLSDDFRCVDLANFVEQSQRLENFFLGVQGYLDARTEFACKRDSE